MKQWKALVGAALMILAVAGMVIWESWGRDALFMKDVVVASRAIPAGQLLKAEDLIVVGIPEEYIVDGAMAGSLLEDMVGLYTINGLSTNQQVCKKDLASTVKIISSPIFSISSLSKVFIGDFAWQAAARNEVKS